MRLITTFIRPAVAAAITALVAPLGAQAQNPSHAHIGHAADGWRDTPEGMGLLPAAQAEAEIAARHAGLAAGAGNIAAVKTHIGHVMHALDPESVEAGPGRGYGMIRAARGAATHVGLAAQADGASDNVKLHAEHVTTSATNAAEWGEAALAQARAIMETDDAAAAAEMAAEIQATLGKIVSGFDANGDGRIGWQAGEGGLEQAAFHLNLIKQGEGIGR